MAHLETALVVKLGGEVRHDLRRFAPHFPPARGNRVPEGSERLVHTLQALGLYGTLAGLIFVHVVYGIPSTTLIFRNYYGGIPNELLEAARIDGAGILGIYRRILLPLSIPGFDVVLIWQFTSIWNEFLFAIILTSNPQVQPMTVALNNLAGSYGVQWNVQMAGALLAALPTLFVYVLLGRYFVRGSRRARSRARSMPVRSRRPRDC